LIYKINVPKAGVFWPYITLFDLKTGFMRNIPHRQLIEVHFTLKKLEIATK